MFIMGNPDIYKTAVPFQKGNDIRRKGNGRKPSKLKKFIKQNNVSSQDMRVIMTNFLCRYSLEELKELHNQEGEKKLPMIVYGLIDSLIDDIEKHKLNSIELALRYTTELPNRRIDLNTHGKLDEVIDKFDNYIQAFGSSEEAKKVEK